MAIKTHLFYVHTPIRISFDLPFVGGKVIGFLVVVVLDGRESGGTFLIGLESEKLVITCSWEIRFNNISNF